MYRRDFLGSVIGLWASMAFFACTVDEPPQKHVELPSDEDFNLLFRDSVSGYTIRAPGVKDIESKYEKWKLIAYPLTSHKTMRVDQVILTDARGRRLRAPSALARPAFLLHGDTLTVDYSLDFRRVWHG